MPLLRVVITSIVLAVLGVAFLVINGHDQAMLRFGWFLVVLGSILAGVFTYLWVAKQLKHDDGEDEGTGGSPKRGKGTKGRR